MANMEDEKDMLINTIEILKNTFGANEVRQAINTVNMMNNSKNNNSQHSLRRSDSVASTRSNRSQQQGNGGWFNNVSNAISNYMDRQSHTNGSTTGSVENMELNEEPISEVQDNQQQASRWKFGWNK